MKPLLKYTYLATATALLCCPAIAQNRFCVGGDLSQLTSAQRTACNVQLQAVRTAVAALHAPADWHYVVVCGEQGWKDLAAFTTVGDALASADADTSLGRRETFFRQSRLEQGGSTGLNAIVAHEVSEASLVRAAGPRATATEHTGF